MELGAYYNTFYIVNLMCSRESRQIRHEEEVKEQFYRSCIRMPVEACRSPIDGRFNEGNAASLPSRAFMLTNHWKRKKDCVFLTHNAESPTGNALRIG